MVVMLVGEDRPIPHIRNSNMEMIEAAPRGPLVTLLFAAALLATYVVIHAAGLIGLARWWVHKDEGILRQRFWKDLWLLVRMSWVMVLLHVMQILLWACFYVWEGCMPDLLTSFYFSSATYTTVGYGDVVLPQTWRNMAGAEALTGILMVGLSTGFFFLVLSRVFSVRHHLK